MLLMLAHGDGPVFGPFSFITFVLRFAQTFFLILPTLIAGFVIAGALRTTHGRAFLAAWFATPIAGLMRAILLGLIAPVGALGALPIVSEMLRAKVRPGHVMAFLVGSALFMPWSFGHLADSVGVINALVVLISSMTTAAIVGLVSGIRSPNSQGEVPNNLTQESSQLICAIRAAARHAVSCVWGYVLVSLAASSAFAAILEAGSIESHLNESAWTTMLELSVPLALSNIDSGIAVAFAGEFWRIGLLSGSMLVAIMIGAGWCVGTLAWSVHRLRLRGVVANLIWLACTLGFALVIHGSISPVRPGEADSHGFDMLTKPANVDSKYSWSLVGERTIELTSQNLPVLIALIGLVVFAVTERLKSHPRITNGHVDEQTIEVSRITQSVRSQLVGLMIVVLLLVANVYSFYPPPSELRERIRLQSGNLADAVAAIISDASSAEDVANGKVRAMNALDQIDRGLSQLKTAGIVRGQQTGGESASLSRLSMQIRKKIGANDLGGIRVEISRLFQGINSAGN